MSGTIRDQTTGRGIASAQVAIVQDVNAGRSATTDSTGSYRLDRLNGGGMRAQVTASGFDGQGIDVPLSGDLVLNFELTAQPVFVYSGTVTDSLGHPVAGVTVRGGPDSAVTDANGRYEFHSQYSSVAGWLRPPAGYERKPIDPTASFPLAPGQNLTVRRITGVTISPPSTVTATAGRVSVNARVTFDTGQVESPYDDSFVMTSTNLTVLGAGSGHGLGPAYVEGLSAGSASVTGTYFGVASSTYQVQVLPR